MFRKTKSAIVAFIVIFSLLMVVSQNSGYGSTNAPAALKIYFGPTSVLADNNSYNCIFIQLVDSSGKPARATQDIVVGLSSSQVNVGTVQPSVTLPKDSTYVATSFQTTFSPGSTTITATASGFTPVQSSIITDGYTPYQVSVYGFPSTLPADGGTYNAILVQLQDSSGAPAKAPKGGVEVTLSSSAANVGSVSPSVFIAEGTTYATANFTTVPNNTKVQTVTIYTAAQGYFPEQLTITTTPVASNPSQLKVFTGPPQIPADANAYPQVAVELWNGTCVCAITSDTSVTMSSTDPTIGQINSQLTIPTGQTYALATLTTTYKAGIITITALATGTTKGTQSITTTGFTPTKLAVFCVPASLPSDNSTYNAVEVQLQDSLGRPAKDPTSDVTVTLSSSQPTIAGVSSSLTIPFGQTQAMGTVSVTNSPGTTTITALGSSYSTGQASMTTYSIDYLPLLVTLTPGSTSLSNGAKTNIAVLITANGAVVTGATIQFTSDSGGTFTTTKELGNGHYNTSFTAPSFTKTTTCTITATTSKTGYANTIATIQITVQPSNSSTSNSTLTLTSPADSAWTGPLTIQLYLKDSNGNPLKGATVSSTVQPDGVQTLSGTTNATGYIVFQNATAGNYTFSVSAKGYYQTITHVDLKNQPSAATLTLATDAASQTSHGGFPFSTILIVVVIAVVAMVAVFVMLKRRKADPADTPTSTY
ncbi:MAG: carboxypeptidase-like regulatory domain-containing protein [Candidatus Bathyarchaeia archaeon]